MSIITGFNSQKYSDFDPRNYAPIGYSDIFPAAMNYSNAEITAFSVSGEGFIDLCTFFGIATSPTSDFSFKFIIDGVTYTFSPTNGNIYAGFSTGDFVTQPSPASGSYGVCWSMFSNGTMNIGKPNVFMLNSANYAGFTFGGTPLFFESSFIVKYSKAVAPTAVTCGNLIHGGLLI